EVPGIVRRARVTRTDAIWTIHIDHRVVAVIILEVQTVKDTGKQHEWSLQAAAAAAEFRSFAKVIVDIIDPELRKWYLKKIHDQPTTKFLTANHIELIVDIEQARVRPLETIWGAVHHAQSDTPLARRVAGIRAALVALTVLEDHLQMRYGNLILGTTPPQVLKQARDQLERNGDIGMEQMYQITSLERRGHSFLLGREEGHKEGREEGRKEGRKEGHEEGRKAGREEGRAQAKAEGLRLAILDIVDVRNLDLDEALHARIETCEDLLLLERWRALAKQCPPGSNFTGSP
ncbi:MAG: hypothetical protein KC457_18895, partial [Myxococcales bacterium]|nr:hypothetical protein [Myxococcales bacterium]